MTTTYSVPLSFTKPSDPDIVTLNIYESNQPTSGFALIDSVSAGIFPNYITRYVTTNALAADDWFAIQWVNAKGAQSTLSAPMKGGTRSLIGEIVERVMLRSDRFDENLIVQEAESVVSFVYGVDDPYSIDIETVSRMWLTELSNLTYVACAYVDSAELDASSRSYSAGVISESASSNSKNIMDSLERLERRAFARLGIGGSRIASIIRDDDRKVIELEGTRTLIDASRLLSTRAFIVQRMIVQDIPSGYVISDR